MKNNEKIKSTNLPSAYKRFIKDMEAAELEVRDYKGRYSYDGPAVVVENIQDALSNTKVPCRCDNMGLQFVVYPK